MGHSLMSTVEVVEGRMGHCVADIVGTRNKEQNDLSKLCTDPRALSVLRMLWEGKRP